jgi:ribose transport system permease protein
VAVRAAAPEVPSRRRGGGDARPGAGRAAWMLISPARISGVYVLAALVIGFSLWMPGLFPTAATFQNITSAQSITAIVAVGLVFTLAAGLFDLSVGYTIGVVSEVAAKLLLHGTSFAVVIVVGLLIALVIGLVNAVVVVGMGIDSFIGTLATGSVLQAVIIGISGNQLLTGWSARFGNLANSQPGGIPVLFLYLIVLAVVAWYLLVHTPFGRHLYAIGKGREAARLAGVRTRGYSVIAFCVTALGAGIAGILLTSNVGTVSTDQGVTYLLPAYAAAFLGATQIQPGRPNVWGTFIAAFLLETGVSGLQLAGASAWVPYAFNGVALILAVGLALAQQSSFLRRQIRLKAPARLKAGWRGHA